jgi:hypothetical protein
MKQNRATLALSIALLAPLGATAAEKQDGHEILGVGRYTCSQMMSNPQAMVRAFDWLDGIISAYNGENSTSITEGLDKNEQQLDLAAHCRMTPDEPMGMVAVQVLGELVTKHRVHHAHQ